VGAPVRMMSSVSREGLDEVLRAVRAEIDDDRLRIKQAEASEEEDTPWQP